MDASSFPSIEVSLRFHPPTALFTVSAPTPAVDHKPTATRIGFPSVLTDSPFAWITSYVPQPHTTDLSTPLTPSLLTSTSTPTIPTAMTSATSTQQRDADTVSSAKIGLAVGITVAVILSLTTIGLAVMDYRRRFKRRKEEKQNRNLVTKGPWAGMEGLEQERMTKHDSKRDGLWGKEWMGSKVALLERMGEGGTRDRREPDWLPEWIPAYLPKDRRSVVSDGGVALSMMGQLVVPMSFLGKKAK